MLQLLTSSQTREADAHTIKNKPISSLDLMESASNAFIYAFKQDVPTIDSLISVYCGTGNNGGDGLAIARLLKENAYDRISVKIARFSAKESADFSANLERLKLTGIPITEITNTDVFPEENAEVIIDALIGSGLNKALQGDLKSLVIHLNQLQKKVIAVDIPTGLPSEGPIDPDACILKASLCVCFQRPKINFFFPESAKALERFKVVEIGLDEQFIQSQAGPWKYIEEKDIRYSIKPRKAFSHKGTYGHALIIAGYTETMGAALLCADACLHSGAGLTTACIPENGYSALNSFAPEVMILPRSELILGKSLEKYSSIAIGPGLGTDKEATDLLEYVLNFNKARIVIDADAINILAANTELLTKLPKDCIICPHVKEFDRLFGKSNSWWDRVTLALKKAKEFNLIILLKNQYTFIVTPDGDILINPTGNPGMAVGGMGDILTGMIASFLAQSYPAIEAAMLAAYIHGAAGDQLIQMNSIPPRYITEQIPALIKRFTAPD
ncbi:yjeF C-terminal region, hydroxyethylthiazole kinase-related/yjeF N-terminal region [Daejeonella rubra]|uniref:Bifunctional NAD(P)H-hydrate repair enzyme n=1 Tax=Daejeonella rubra TaxID=990371 RepID=A0A1G9WAA8_9SPHI|nr:NAD(P)H-hydrate dehydratase [Daejeonella rubra]SDM81146.1 yjeF C-terminal region, hydroxyethylthiazole kinase-related/yjeF N-terminal region [Daejeonella rubra]